MPIKSVMVDPDSLSSDKPKVKSIMIDPEALMKNLDQQNRTTPQEPSYTIPLGDTPNIPMDEAKRVAPYIPDALPAVGGAVGSVVPGAGSTLGAGLGSVIATLMRNEGPSIFSHTGDAPSAEDAIGGMGKDIALQGLIPGGVEAALNPRQTIAKVMASRVGKMFPAVKNGIQATETAGFMNPAATSEEASSVRELFSKGMKGDKVTDPDKITEALNNGYESSISPTTRKNINDFMGTISKQKGVSDNVIGYAKNRIVFSAPVILAGVATGHTAATAAGAGSLILTNAAFSKLMANPEMAQLVTQAAKTGLKAEESPLIQKALMGALRGSEVYVQTPEGQEKAVVGENGQLQYPSK